MPIIPEFVIDVVSTVRDRVIVAPSPRTSAD
jgi:hypothetical protein